MLTAEEARLLMPTVESAVMSLLKTLKERAKRGHRSIRTIRWDYTKDLYLWNEGGYDKSQAWKDAKKMLEGLGYSVNFYYSHYDNEKYTLVEW